MVTSSAEIGNTSPGRCGVRGSFCTSEDETNWKEELYMAGGKEHRAEQIVNLLRQVEVGVANGKTLPQACRKSRSWSRRTIDGGKSRVA
jgi:hypothetical protein